MKILNSLFSFLLASGLSVPQATAFTQVSLDFESFPTASAPQGFSTALTGQGKPGNWRIQEDPTAPRGPKVLAQTDADPTDYRFPLCIFDGVKSKDVDVAVKFRPVSGKVDQAGGLVARYRDKDNYYVVRANALENNVRLYKVVAGSRRMFAGKSETVASNRWHELRLEVRKTHFKVYFDGKLLFEADDDTFQDTGKVGLWTKADSVTYFDDFQIMSYDAK